MKSTDIMLIVVFLAAALPLADSCPGLFGGGGGGCGCGGGCSSGCGGRKKRSTGSISGVSGHILKRLFEEYSSTQSRLASEARLLSRAAVASRRDDTAMATDPMTSKTALVSALHSEGDQFFVVCAPGRSVYSAPRNSVFCSSSAYNHTCFVLGF
ncbi:unnamed protein product [Nippostrongylus brasiliensis]|uniref:Ground-like domain-containing protein n=1 Tax=Nippostrongylus brasiliensis TaxID=27835 RepID=A0A0N4YAG2_NIPBR|nr:unnamed protein product [Nippostrongylus brasiliensis]